MFYRFDVDRWIIQQLPPILRRPAVYAFLRALLFPLKQLLQSFTAYREAIDRQLSYNAFEIYLEKWLNDVLFFPAGTIYITDEVLPIVALSLQSEGNDPVYMSNADEDPATPLQLYSTPPDMIIGEFIVHVPTGLSDEQLAIIRQWVDYYKFAGTQYRIIEYAYE